MLFREGKESEMETEEKIVIIGVNHAGIAVAKNLNRSGKNFEITMIDKGSNLGYLNCGTPFLLANTIDSYKKFFYTDDKTLSQEVAALYTGSNVKAIDFRNKKVSFEDSKGSHRVSYDKLVLATGASQVSLGVSGNELQGIYRVKDINKALEVKKKIESDTVKNIAIIGGGYIGVELAAAIKKQNKNITIFDANSQLMSSHYDEIFGEIVSKKLVEHGISVKLNEEVQSYVGKDDQISQIITNHGKYSVDMVILTMGFLPNTTLGRFHLELYTNGAYIVNEHQQTSDPDVYAVGDCSTSYSNILKELVVNFSVSDAMRGAYIAAKNIAGEPVVSNGTQLANAVRVYDTNFFSAGITVAQAERYGVPCSYVDYEEWQRPEFMLENNKIKLRLVYHQDNHRIIGAQIVSKSDQSGILHMLSLAIQKEVTIEELQVSDFFFYPYFNQPNNFVIEAVKHANLVEEEKG